MDWVRALQYLLSEVSEDRREGANGGWGESRLHNVAHSTMVRAYMTSIRRTTGTLKSAHQSHGKHSSLQAAYGRPLVAAGIV